MVGYFVCKELVSGLSSLKQEKECINSYYKSIRHIWSQEMKDAKGLSLHITDSLFSMTFQSKTGLEG